MIIKYPAGCFGDYLRDGLLRLIEMMEWLVEDLQSEPLTWYLQEDDKHVIVFCSRSQERETTA